MSAYIPRYAFWLLCLLIGLGSRSAAQELSPRFEFGHIREQDRLSSSKIHSLFQDKGGYRR